jgi:hypothetical protein
MPLNKQQLDKVLAAFAAMRDKGRAQTTVIAGQTIEVQSGETSTPQGIQPRKPVQAQAPTKQG